MGVLQDLKTNLGMGARANKYRITMDIQGIDGKVIDTLCKGAAIPAKTVGQIEVFKQGRKIILAGDAEFEGTWTLTFWNTETMQIRNTISAWMTLIDNVSSNSRAITGHNDYMTTAQIEQLSSIDGTTGTSKFEFYDMWPTNISAIELADESNNTITEFTVDFAYSYWEQV